MSPVFLDVIGYNYKLADYAADHERYPQRIFVGTESYPKDVVATWKLTNESPWLIGDFVWTAIDYFGEAGTGGSIVLAPNEANDPAAMAPAWPPGECVLRRHRPGWPCQAPVARTRRGLGYQCVGDGRATARSGREDDLPRQWGWADEYAS